MTLIELTLAMGLGMSIAAIVLVLVNQQIAFLRIFGTQNFLTEEAPMIGMYVGKIAGKAERFRLYNSVNDAKSKINPQLGKASVLAMDFRQPDGTWQLAYLVFENKNSRNELNYYLEKNTVTPPEWVSAWPVSTKAREVSFSVINGILQMRIEGTSGEVITYSGTMQQ